VPDMSSSRAQLNMRMVTRMTSWTPRHLATLLSHKKPLSRRAERLTENDICGPSAQSS